MRKLGPLSNNTLNSHLDEQRTTNVSVTSPIPRLALIDRSLLVIGLGRASGKNSGCQGALVPAGKKRRLVTKLFVSSYVLELAADQDWLDKARDILALHWKEKNSKKPERSGRTAPHFGSLNRHESEA